MTDWRHDDLMNDLAAHLRGTRDRVVWTDMQLGPVGSPRPDVYTMPKSFARFTPLAYEIKISVADFRSDITKGKWQSYLKFASGVIFAVPAGLIKKDDVPAGCGLLVRSDAGWRAARGPTLKVIDTLPRDAWIKLMIDGLGRQHHELNPRELGTWAAADKIRKAYGDEIGNALRDRDMAVNYLEQETKKIRDSQEKMIEQERAARLRARNQVDHEVGEINQIKADFAKALGLDEDAGIWKIREAAASASKRLTEVGEIAHLRNKLELAQKYLAEGVAAVPMIARAA